MRALNVLCRRLHWVAIGLCLSILGLSQGLSDFVDYEVFPSCINHSGGKEAIQDRYYISLSITSIPGASEDFEILVDGNREAQFSVNSTDLPYSRSVGPYPHSGIGGSYRDVVLRSLTSGLDDDLIIGEVVCGYYTSGGNNMAGYFCSYEGYDLIAQAAPEKKSDESIPEKENVYVLVQKSTNVVHGVNKSGLFESVNDSITFEIHAFSVPFSLADDFVNGLTIGQVLDSDSPNVCFAFCGIYEIMVDCSSFDLALEKELESDPILALGDTVTYAITVFNEGTVTAYDIVIRDMVPEGLSFNISLNPGWNTDLEYHSIDSIAAGKNETVFLTLTIDLISPFIQIINEAEIFFASKDHGSDILAYDIDSTPDNEEEGEDDQDDVELMILENLCNETFEVGYYNHPVCQNEEIRIDALAISATAPLTYVWVFDGSIISDQETLVIDNPGPSDFGQYGLTVIDANGCQSSHLIMVEPVFNDQFSCLSRVNLSLPENCLLNFDISSWILREVSGLDDYIIEIYDEHNNLLDPDQFPQLNHGDILNVKIINPCTENVVCWVTVNIEFKLTPSFEYYSDTSRISCLEVTSSLPGQIIDEYNALYDPILSAHEYRILMESQLCLGGWEVETIDDYAGPFDGCTNNLISRIYLALKEDQSVYLDTAYLLIESIDVHDIEFPVDLSNLACDTQIHPGALYSHPFVLSNGDSIWLAPDPDAHNNGLATRFCNVAINYMDEVIGTSCAFGANKILRKWTVIDWCSNQTVDETQFLFVIDESPPEIALSKDTLIFYTDSYTCEASIDLSSYIGYSDNCDNDPHVGISSGFAFTSEWEALDVPVGYHKVTIFAEDRCHNRIERELTIAVEERTPPVPILLEYVVLTFNQSSTTHGLWITSDQFNSSSHDFGCGAVYLEIARHHEVKKIKESGQSLAVEDFSPDCYDDSNVYDENHDGHITVAELFRDKLLICCEDLGKELKIAVRVTDYFGNYSDASSVLSIDIKESSQSCDDGDPCTIDDLQFGTCPCAGRPDERDSDMDGIPDCSDDAIILCLDGESITTDIDQASVLLDQGAVPGPCSDEELVATIAGEVYSMYGDMVQYVEIDNSGIIQYVTSTDGQYHFFDNPMYDSYTLTPERDDNPLNGVTALDLVLIQEHVLGLGQLENPLLFVAADATGDGKVSAADLLEIKSLLLGLTNKFQNNKSWRFIPARLEPLPGESPFPLEESIHIEFLTKDSLNEDWIGIKTGDVSGDARPNDLKSTTRNEGIIEISLEDRWVAEGSEFQVNLNASDEVQVRALQFGLLLNDLELLGIRSANLEIASSNFALHGPENEAMSFVWYDHEGKDLQGYLFTLLLKANKDGQLGSMIEISEGYTQNLFYTGHETTGRPIALRAFDPEGKSSDQVGVLLHQNRPNPFSSNTTIEFEIPQKAYVEISFIDTKGALIHKIEREFDAGRHSVLVNGSDLDHIKGLVYYQIETLGTTISRSMVVGMN